MATLTGTQIANTYKQLLQVGSGNNGLTASVQNVQDGQGNNSPLQLSQSAVNIDGTFQLNGVTLTANASALNDIADLTGATGIIAVSGGNVYGRTLTGGTGVSITNADGTEGNPTIALNPTGVVSASYGPATNIEINSVGQVVSAGAVTSVSVSGVTANTFTGGTFAGTTGDFSSNVSVGGNLVIAGQFSPASLSVTGTINATKISATDATFNNNVSVGGNLVIAGQFSPAALSVTGTVNAANISATDATFNNNVSVGGNLVVTGQLSPAALSVTGTVNATKISATNATFNSVVSAGFFVGDGSGLINVPSVEGGTVKFITAGTGIKLTVDAAVTTTIPVSGTVAVSANQNFGSVSVSTALAVTGSALFGIVSATNIDTDELLIAGVSAATVTEVAAVSALTQINLDSITSINGIIEGNVSADSGTFNTLTVVTSASVGGTFNVGGNVGIGTASPAVPLHISSATPAIRLTDTDDNSDAQIGAASGGLIVFDADINNEVAGSAILFRVDGGSEKMRITSTGNVGIGTSSPLKKLDVSSAVAEIAINSTGSSYSRVNHYHNGTVLWTTGTRAATDYHIYRESGGGNVIIDNSNVGIGTSSPTAKADILTTTAAPTSAIWTAQNLTLRDDTAYAADVGGALTFEGKFNTAGAYSTFGYIRGSKTDASDGGFQGGIVYGTRNGNHVFVTNSSGLTDGTDERMRITNGGNVGIGTASPLAKLHSSISSSGAALVGGVNVAAFLEAATNTSLQISTGTGSSAYINLGDAADIDATRLASQPGFTQLSASGASDYLRFDAGGFVERMRINSSGNVLIGTTSDTTDLAYAPKLKLSGSGPVLYLEETDTSQDYSVTALGGKFYIRDATAVVPRLTIDSSGNVGIGIASPATKFHVLDGTSSLRFRQNGTVAETLTVGPSGGDAAIYLGDVADTVRAGLYYDTSENDLQIRGYNNSTRILIDSVGNVGIGTTSPSTKTEISTNNETSILRLTDTATIGAVDRKVGGIEFYQNDASGGAGIGSSIEAYHVNISGDTDLRFATGDNTERMRINSSGNVGIDTTVISNKISLPIGQTVNIGATAGTAHQAGNVGSVGLTITDGGNANGVRVHNTHNGTFSSSDIRFTTGEGGVSSGLERMRIETSGNVGINTTTTLGAKLFVSQGAAASPATSGNMTTGAVIGSSTAGQALNVGTDADGVWYNAAYANNAGVARIHRWLTGGTERMRIDTSGTLLVGMTASSDTLANTGIELYNNGRLNATRTGNPVLYLNRKTSGGTIVTFRLDGNEEGTISIDSSSGVSYNTTSDYRLKENVTEVTGAANRVKALNPVRFNFIAAPDKIVDGFLAHEVSNIVPEAIHGEKDAIDAEGNPKYQGIDQSKLVPLLTAALQEALTKIDELEARVAALETA